MAKLSSQKKEWQAENDARTLILALDIEADKSRKKAAIAKLKEKARDAEKAVKKVTKKSVKRSKKK